jgi:hypothetical protein
VIRIYENDFFAVDIRDSEVSNHRNELTASFVNYLAAISLIFYYKTTEVDQLAVVGRVMGRDDFGNPVDHIAFTYSLDRLTCQKIDPDHISLLNILRKAAKEPVIAEWARSILFDDMLQQ